MADLESCDEGHLAISPGALLHGRYRLTRRLGRGNFSDVYLCRDLEEPRHVAVKIAKSTPGCSSAADNELSMLIAIRDADPSDPNREKLIQLVDNFVVPGEDSHHVCIVLEVLRRDLWCLLGDTNYEGLPVDDVKTIMRQVLEGLDYLHTKCNMIHTDIKSENVMVCADESYLDKLSEESGTCDANFDEGPGCAELNVKISDLGTACKIHEHDMEGMRSLHYGSPNRPLEIILGGGFGPTADIWSAACMAFILATGRDLFKLDEDDYSDEAHLARIVAMLGDIPQSVVASGEFSENYFDLEGALLDARELEPTNLVSLLLELGWQELEATRFSQFLAPMLRYDPEMRATAKQCLEHQWLEDSRDEDNYV